MWLGLQFVILCRRVGGLKGSRLGIEQLSSSMFGGYF
ncbi:hypothetical protein NC652_039372 [Populus alba x Populus x berolinensis]|nr:hypothetical protein NC652_039372 [Populus alba x Populus x berolinensis]